MLLQFRVSTQKETLILLQKRIITLLTNWEDVQKPVYSFLKDGAHQTIQEVVSQGLSRFKYPGELQGSNVFQSPEAEKGQ